jgi:hypothetical protein
LFSARVNGHRVTVHDPHGACYVCVEELPRNIDRRGYDERGRTQGKRYKRPREQKED